MKTLLTILLLTIGVSHSKAEVRYVSHTGTSTPPYTSWQTAADSIQKCVDYSTAGDTIYVANGVYKEKIIIQDKFLTLIGSSWDSCIVDSRDLEVPTDFYTFYVEGDIHIQNFRVLVSYSHKGDAFVTLNASNQTVIENNRVENCGYGATLFNSHLTFKHNLITDANHGVHLEAFNANYYPVVDSNVIVTAVINLPADGIECGFGTSPTIRGNIIVNENTGDGLHNIFDPPELKNNLVLQIGVNSTSILYHGAFIGSTGSGEITNNLVVSSYADEGYYFNGGGNKIENNCSVGAETGFILNNVSPIIFHYNNVWDAEIPYYNFTADSTNIAADPMFNNPDSMDFHLQMFSPLIDRGDPEILDKDGSRSDIGLYGGPLGETYTYQDLAPRPPVNLTGIISTDTTTIELSWNRNTEADFSHYNIFRDTTDNFPADSTRLIASVTDTFCLSMIPLNQDNLYYKLTAVDSQGNESTPSEELPVILTGIDSREPITISGYRLYQNYPNPFNPSTRIGYRLKEGGYVKLMVYDIKGELVETLVNQYQPSGYYEVEFTGKKESGGGSLAEVLASGIYLYRIEVINSGHIPVYTEIRKMVYIK